MAVEEESGELTMDEKTNALTEALKKLLPFAQSMRDNAGPGYAAEFDQAVQDAEAALGLRDNTE